MGCIASKFMSPSMIFKGKLKQSKKRQGNNIPDHPEIIKDHFLTLVCTATTTKQAAVTDNNRTWEYMSSPEQEPLKLIDEEMGAGSARSFHTVEEYDLMVEKLKSCGGEEGDDCSDGDGYVIEEMQEQEEHIEGKIDGVEEKEEVLSVIQDTSSSTDTITSLLTAKTTRFQEQEDVSEKESGYKRKCIAKRLESLEIPESNELPPVASLREWLQVHSPSPINERNEVFNPELVAACEECMQQLEAEAEAILREITAAEEQEEEETK